MESFRINGKRFNMPSGWHEVSFKNAMEVIHMDDVEVFSKLSGIPLEECRELEDPEALSYFISSFRFLKNHPQIAEIPLSFMYGDERILCPETDWQDIKDLGKMNVGQLNDIKSYYLKHFEELSTGDDWKPSSSEIYQVMPGMVAIYVQKLIDKKYDYGKAMSMVEEVQENMSFKDVVAIASFFLLRLNASLIGSQKTQPKSQSVIKKAKQAHRSFQNVLDLFTR